MASQNHLHKTGQSLLDGRSESKTAFLVRWTDGRQNFTHVALAEE